MLGLPPSVSDGGEMYLSGGEQGLIRAAPTRLIPRFAPFGRSVCAGGE